MKPNGFDDWTPEQKWRWLLGRIGGLARGPMWESWMAAESDNRRRGNSERAEDFAMLIAALREAPVIATWVGEPTLKVMSVAELNQAMVNTYKDPEGAFESGLDIFENIKRVQPDQVIVATVAPNRWVPIAYIKGKDVLWPPWAGKYLTVHAVPG